MIKKIVILLVYGAVTGLFAQNGTASPYSYFGIGDLRATSTAENQMMGGIGIFADSIHINLKNPAAYSKLGIPAGGDYGITTYAAGISRKELRLKSFTEEERSSITNLDYLALAFSWRKGVGIGFGVMPYSSVGYNLVSETTNNNGEVVTNQYSGEGGLNKVYLSIGYEVVKNLSVGVTGNLNFGTIESSRLQMTEDVQFGTKDERLSKVNGVDFTYALNYTPKISERHTLHSSLRFNAQANLVARNTRRIGSFSLQNGADIEVVDVDLVAQGLEKEGFQIPTTTTIGLGYGEDRKWFLGAEYSFQGLSGYSNNFLDTGNLVYEDASSLALGGFIVPDFDSFDNYLNRITYRAGLRFDKTGMMVNDKEINNFGITFGVGLPLSRLIPSNLNLGFELGRRGTTSADLIEESYFKVNVGLSLNDLWFRKRKIN
ncbi:hypothetical protein [uncultured Kriegella sp.]|uniref:hypothetical protein n=1 Tax=uncultured Kriegella sp. TaxID=1798910 RepID=UPI0030D8CCF9|tara:strand:+ start:848 stop:2140 length:1293 start_codon:yes stop_codon:yes gene_type:complete